jgi:hypothetical protein
MTEQATEAQLKPTQDQLQERKHALLRLFDRMLPVIDGVSDTVRFIALLGLALVIWVFVWMVHFHGFSLLGAGLVCAVIVLPIGLLMYLWWSLEELKQLPETVANALQGAKHEVREKVLGIRAGGKQKMSIVGSAKSVFKIGSMVGEARELLGSYVRVGSLVNPLLLLLGVLSILYIIPLSFVGFVLAVLALWP